MDARAAALSALAQFQVTETTVGEALQRIAGITAEAIPAARVVGMSMLDDDGRPTTAVYTDVESPEIDAAQYRENKGPCLDAWRQNVVLRVPRVEEQADTYPAFAAACLQHGVRSTLSLPMTTGAVAVGALNLYAHVPEAFSDEDESVGKDLAAASAAVMINVSAYWTAFDLSTQLTEAMSSRAVIEQAKGVLMARQPGLTADEAFDMLRCASQRANRKLRDIALQIVGRPGDLGGPGGGLAVSADDVVNALEQLSAVLQSQRTLGAALAGIAEASVVSVPGCDAASVALSVQGRSATAAATARVALELDLVQYDSGDGPCLTAFRSLETLRLDVVEDGDAFPHFARAARERGVLGVLSLPATWGSDIVATLNLYSRQGSFDETAASIASVLAAQVAIAVSRSPEFAAARATVEQAQRDLEDRTQLDMAAGMLMATQGCTAEQAHGLLHQAADQEERTILQIAQRIIDQHKTSQ